MNHYMDFDPYVIRERNQQVHREVRSLRLEERLREEPFAKRGVRTLLYEVHRAVLAMVR